MKPVERKSQLKPDRLAKNALRQAALQDMAKVGLPTTASVTVEYAGIRHTVPANVVVSLKDGQVLLNFAATGSNRMQFTIGGQEYSFGLIGNVLTGLAVENFNEVRAKYGLPVDENAILEAGESTK
jgi:hypothetical protein